MMNSLSPHHTENNRPRAVPPFRPIAPRKKTQIKKSARKKIDVGIRGPIWKSHSQSFAQCANNVYFFFADFFRLGEGFYWKGRTARKLWKERPPLGKVNKGSLAPRGKCKSLWWKERLSAESNPWFFGFVSLRSVVGLQNSRHPCNQWDIKLKKANCELVTSVFPRFNAIGSMQYLSLFWLATVITLVLIRRYSIDKLSNNLTIVT